MRKFLIGATTALATLALAGGVASAQEGAYTLPPGSNISAGATCTPISNPPQLNYSVGTNQAFKGTPTLVLSFTRNGSAFGSPIAVSSNSGTTDFPTQNGYLADGWTQDNNLWFPGPEIMMTAVFTDPGDGGATYTSLPVPVTYNLDDDICVASLPPATTVPGVVPPVVTVPPAQQPPPALPATGMSTFESGMRIGAFLLIGGLGFVIVARRRRFATASAPSATA